MRAGDSYDRSLGLMVGSELRRAAELANRTVTALSLFVPRCVCERTVTEASPSSEPPVSRALRTHAEDSVSWCPSGLPYLRVWSQVGHIAKGRAHCVGSTAGEG
jgi:hypothetical protein